MGQQRTSLTEGGSQKLLCVYAGSMTETLQQKQLYVGCLVCMGVGDMGHRDTDTVIASCLSVVTQTSNHGLGMLRLP